MSNTNATILIALIFLLISFVPNAESKDQKGVAASKRIERVERALTHHKSFKLKKVTKVFAEEGGSLRVIVKTRQLPFQDKRSLKSRQERETVKKNVKKGIDLITSRFLNLNSIKIKNKFSYQHGFSAEVSLDGLEKLLADDDVLQVYEDRKRKPMLAQGIPLMQGSTVRQSYGGDGVSIAILDTGIDYNHPMLGGGGFPNAKVLGGTDTGEDDSDPIDSNGHGTAVAGIAAGNEPNPFVGDYVGGVAPNAKLYALKITWSDGLAYDSDVIEAIEWCITHQYDDPANPIKIINISFGGDKYTGYCDNYDESMQIGAQAVDNARQAGISIFVSSGNDGYTDAMAAPACYSGVVSVGEVYDSNVGSSGPWLTDAGSCTDSTTYSDLVTCYSNSSSTLDLLAPGSNAYTLDVLGSGGKEPGAYNPDFGGTSAASPYAAGAAALLQSLALKETGSFLTPEDLKNIMISKGVPVGDPKSSIVTPRVTIEESFQALKTKGDLNRDKFIDLKDLILSLQLLTGNDTGSTLSLLADISDDFKISMEEAIYISRYSSGAICSVSSVEDCITRNSCEDAGGLWYAYSCNQIPTQEFEPNDDKRFANVIAFDSVIAGSLATGDEDWYVVYTNAERVVTVSLESADYLAGNVEIYDGNNNLLANLRLSVTKNLSAHLSTAGYFFVRVTGTGDVGYDLLVDSNDDIPLNAWETEPNGNRDSANSILLDTEMAGNLTYSDEDWYVLHSDVERLITVSIKTSNRKTGVAIYNDKLALLATLPLEDSLSLNVHLPVGGTYYIKVSDTIGREAIAYSLLLSSNDGIPLPPWETEPNNWKVSANEISFGAAITGQLMPTSDIDWYMLYADSERIATVSLQTPATHFLITVAVYDDMNNQLARKGLINDITLTVTLPTAGTYYIKVLYSSIVDPYQLLVQ